MQMALFIAQVIVSIMLIVLVIVQARTPGMSGQSASSIHHTRRGVEKTLHQTTIGVAVVFLLLALVNSLPLFG